jgi:hypothetical protein
MTTAMVVNASRIATVDLIDEITVTTDPILAMTIGINVIITTITAVMTDATTTIVTTTLICAIKVIIVMITTTIVTMTGATIDVIRTTTTAKTTTGKSGHLRHHPKGATPMVHSRRPTVRSTSSLVVAKRSKPTGKLDRTPEIGHVNTENPRPLRWSVFPITFSRKDHWVQIPDPGTYPLVVNPIVNGAWLPKTLIDGGSSLNIIFKETLRKMEFDLTKMTACDEPFYGVVPGKAAYPIGRMCLPVTFSTEENFRMEYLTFEVADFRSSYHAIFRRPMLAKFMAIPHHTYLIMKMSAPNGILSILGDIMVSYNCESATVELSKDSAIKAAATVMVAQATKIDQTTLQVPEQKCTSTALDPSPAIKKVCLGLPDASKEVVIGADLDPK